MPRWRRVGSTRPCCVMSSRRRGRIAGDRTSRWTPRCGCAVDAECSPQRGFYYHPSRHSAGQPIVAGWCYSWLVGLSAGADSWTAPLDSRRVLVGENANVVAAQQIRQLLPRLGALPMPALFALDGGYDPVQLTVETAGTGVQLVVRVRDDRVFYARAPQRLPGGRAGAPRRHGARFSCADASSWPVPDAVLEVTDDVYGEVTVTAWHQLHPKQRTYREPAGALRIVEAVPPRPAGRRAGRAARRRTVQPTGAQLRHRRPFETGSLIACEVLTPGGNWSSYPAHKHDQAGPTRVGARGDLLLRDRGRPARSPASASTRPAPRRRRRGARSEVRDRDTALVPFGGTDRAWRRPGTTCTT